MNRWKWVIFFLILSSISKAQVPLQFSQIFDTKELVNPAFSVMEETFFVKFLYRTQWAGLEGNPVTSGLSLYSPLGKQVASIGGTLVNVMIGSLVQTNLSAYANIDLRVSQSSNLAFSFQAGGEYSFFDPTKTITYHDLDPYSKYGQGYENIEDNTFFNPTFGTGILYYNPRYYISLSTFLMLNGNKYLPVSFYEGTYGAVGLLQNLNYDWRLREMALYKMMYHDKDVMELGVNMLYRDVIGFGLSYRHKESVLLTTDIKLNDKLRLGLGYDMQTTQLQQFSFGSFEFRIEYRATDKRRRFNRGNVFYHSY